MQRSSHGRRLAVVCAVAMAAVSLPADRAQAQTNNSDVTGVNVNGSTTTGGVFTSMPMVLTPVPAPQTAPGVPAIAVPLTAPIAALVTMLVSGTAVLPGSTTPLPVEAGVLMAQLGVARLGSEVLGNCCAVIQSNLAAAVGAPPAPVITRFFDAFAGVLTDPRPERIAAAVEAFNAMVQGAGESYLASPPAEFAVAQWLLSQFAIPSK